MTDAEPSDALPAGMMTPEECIAHGGHCWIQGYRSWSGDDCVMAQDQCRHCLTTREGSSTWTWTLGTRERQPYDDDR